MSDQIGFHEGVFGVVPRLLSRTEQGIGRRDDQIASMEAQLATIRTEVKRLKQIETVLSAIRSSIEAGHWCDVVRHIDRSKDLGSLLDDLAPGTSEEVMAVRQAAVEQAEESLSNLSAALPAALDAAGITLDTSSRFPSFKFRRGFFEIKINQPRFEAQVIIRHGRTVKVASDVDLIMDAVLGEEARCFGGAVSLPDFVHRLRAAYRTVLGSDKPRPLSLEDVRAAITEPNIPRDEFSVTLGAVLTEKPVEAGDMNLDHTKEIDTGFLLPGFEDRGYFGHISFTTV